MLRRRGVLLAVALVGFGVFFCVRLTRSHQPVVEDEIARIASPGGVWTAKAEMVVYGDRWFVNDARYEVRIERTDKVPEGLVYSVPASGSTSISIKWQANDELVITDSSSAMRIAVRQVHPLVKVDYRSLGGA